MFRQLAKDALQYYAARLPYHRGKWRVIEGAVRVFGIEAADHGLVFEVERQGLRWSLGIECAMQRKFYYHGAMDPYDEREFLPLIRPGSVFFDIGSYFGYYGLLAAQRGAHVFAFEPASANFRLLRHQEALNRLDRFQMFPIALSDCIGRTTMSVAAEGNRGTGRIDALNDGATPVEQIVTTTLDAFVREHAIERLDALKLDVEGAECKVLSGGSETLARFRPTMLMELNPHRLERFGVSEERLLAMVRELGYCPWRATARGLVKYKHLGPDEEYCNLLCRPV